jgi:hypothetical protein
VLKRRAHVVEMVLAYLTQASLSETEDAEIE